MNIIVDTRCETPAWSEETIVGLATFALAYEKAPEACEVSVTLVDEDQIADLNRRYRGIDRPTDVLSFPMDDPWEDPDEEEIPIGDIMIAPTIAAAQAPEYGNSFEDEMSLLLVHGCLHLLGYDHIEDAEAEVMEAHERAILAAWRERRDGTAGVPTPIELKREDGRTKPIGDTESKKFSYALEGIFSAMRTERNLRIDICVAVVALILCFFLKVELWGWVAVLIFISLVLFAEMFNTAIETVVDMTTPEFHPLAKRAKDIAAGAVFILAILAFCGGLVIYIDAFMKLIG